MKTLLRSILTTASICLCTTSALAGASEWFVTDGARLRLISMPSLEPGKLNAGLQFELEKGWKTYWRSPGGSGIPPQVQFLGSQNLASTKLLFPIPEHFSDDGSLGYKGAVTLPIDVELKSPNAPTSIVASGFVGLCSEICVPVQFRLSLKHDPRGGTRSDIARAFIAATAELPGKYDDKQNVSAAQYIEADTPKVKFSVVVPDTAKNVALYVEGPTNWYLQQPKLVGQDAGTAEFLLSLDDLPKNANVVGEELRMTLVADGKGVEQKIAIASAKTP